jgi:DNA-binding NarL/FixJ family response regulator
MRYEEPMKIIEILRLGEQGYSQREIARSVNCGKSTVGGSAETVQSSRTDL